MFKASFYNLPVSLAFTVVLAALVASCGTSGRVRQLEFRRLMAEKESLVTTRARLISGPLPPPGTQLEVFLSSSSINEALQQAVGFTFELENVKGTTFRVDELAANFGNGLPDLTVQITARSPKHGYVVQVRTASTLELIRENAGEPKLRLRVHVADIAPDVRWKFFRIRFGLFVRKLLRVKGQQLADLTDVEVPLSELLIYERAAEDARKIVIGDATVAVHTVGDKFQVSRRLQVSDLMFLKDGIRVFLTLVP
jgi:hypothetical protein